MFSIPAPPGGGLLCMALSVIGGRQELLRERSRSTNGRTKTLQGCRSFESTRSIRRPGPRTESERGAVVKPQRRSTPQIESTAPGRSRRLCLEGNRYVTVAKRITAAARERSGWRRWPGPAARSRTAAGPAASRPGSARGQSPRPQSGSARTADSSGSSPGSTP